MKDWRDNVIQFLNKHDDNFFLAEWLANYFNTTISVMSDFLDELEALDIVYHRDININLEKYWLYRRIE